MKKEKRERILNQLRKAEKIHQEVEAVKNRPKP